MNTPSELEVENLRREKSRRSRLICVGLACLLAVAGLGFVAWKATWHMMAASWLGSNSIKVDWQIDKETWKRGGVTTVKAVINYSFLTSNSNRGELRCLDRLQNVESLDLAQTIGLSDSDVAVIGDLTDLTFLSLDQTGTRNQYQAEPVRLTDATLARITNLTRLKELYLGGHKFTDAGMPYLAKLTNLEVLDLGGSPITDAGLEPLKRMTRLRNVTLVHTKVTAEGVKALEAALPNTSISSDITTATDR